MRPASICRFASLPIVVVLPTPFTPTKSHTGTRPLCAVVVTTRSAVSESKRLTRTAAATPSGAPFVRKSSRIMFVVATPTSLRSSTSSTTSSCSSLNAPTPDNDRTRSKTLRDEPSRCARDGTSSEGRSANSVTRTVGIAARGGAGVSARRRRRDRTISTPSPPPTTTATTTMMAMITPIRLPGRAARAG